MQNNNIVLATEFEQESLDILIENLYNILRENNRYRGTTIEPINPIIRYFSDTTLTTETNIKPYNIVLSLIKLSENKNIDINETFNYTNISSILRIRYNINVINEDGAKKYNVTTGLNSFINTEENKFIFMKMVEEFIKFPEVTITLLKVLTNNLYRFDHMLENIIDIYNDIINRGYDIDYFDSLSLNSLIIGYNDDRAHLLNRLTKIFKYITNDEKSDVKKFEKILIELSKILLSGKITERRNRITVISYIKDNEDFIKLLDALPEVYPPVAKKVKLWKADVINKFI